MAAVLVTLIAIKVATWSRSSTLAEWTVTSPEHGDITFCITEEDEMVYLSALQLKPAGGTGWSMMVLLGKVEEVGGRTADVTIDDDTQHLVFRVGKIQAQFDLKELAFIPPAAPP